MGNSTSKNCPKPPRMAQRIERHRMVPHRVVIRQCSQVIREDKLFIQAAKPKKADEMYSRSVKEHKIRRDWEKVHSSSKSFSDIQVRVAEYLSKMIKVI